MQDGYVENVFQSVAKRYDLVNHILSFGMDYLWRRKTVHRLDLKPGMKVLDMCCGTGDLAFEIAKTKIDGIKITGCDFSNPMLEIAKEKEKRLVRKGKISPGCVDWTCGDCTSTDFPAGSFDRITCGFGMRNMQHGLDNALKEIYRLLRPGGKACILEFSLPRTNVIRWIYLIYLKCILPCTGGLITGDVKSYRYLADSICRWSNEIDLAASFKAAGLEPAGRKSMSFGTVCLDIAEKE